MQTICPTCHNQFFSPPDFAGKRICPHCIWKEQGEKNPPVTVPFEYAMYFVVGAYALGVGIGLYGGWKIWGQ